MTIIASTGNAIPGANGQGTLDFLIVWLDFMRGAPGWTIPRSSDGSSGGAGDFIDSAADLSQFSAGSSESWFVLRSPDGLKEFLFERATSDDDRWDVQYSASAAYVGGDAGNPPASPVDRLTCWQGDIIDGNPSFTAHFLADDAAPYGWAVYCNVAGVPTTNAGAFGFMPISVTQPGETDPFVTYFGGGGGSDGWITGSTEMGTEAFAFQQPICRAHPPGDAVTEATVPACVIASYPGSTVKMFPSACSPNNDNEDISFPIPFGLRSTKGGINVFKGFSTFAQWNGVARAPLETFAGLTRISFGDVNFPWDGSTVPTP